MYLSIGTIVFLIIVYELWCWGQKGRTRTRQAPKTFTSGELLKAFKEGTDKKR